MEIAKIKISGTSVEVSDLKTVTSGMVGATVGIEYDNTWDGLNKQVVFKTAFKTVNADGTAVPPELLRISGVNLQVGVYGYTDDGTVAIPTVWASLGNIKPGADPEGDEAAKPTNPIWIEAIETAKNADGKAEDALEAAVSAERKADALVPRVELLEANISQPDWNVNDETDPAYIKNRPFYATDPVLTELLPETTLQFQSNDTLSIAFFEVMPELLLESMRQNDQHYTVNWDGNEYEVTASPYMGEVPILGNLSILNAELAENTGEPFLFFFDGEDPLVDPLTVATTDPGTEHTVSITHVDQTIHKLDEKFLPDLDLGVGKAGEGQYSEVFNYNCTAPGMICHAEGNETCASGINSHAEGSLTKSSGEATHAEGWKTVASGDEAHAEGAETVASGFFSHAEGRSTQTYGNASHAEGMGTIAQSDAQHAQGRYNVIHDYDDNYAHIVGNGNSDTDRSDAHTLDWDGNAWYAGYVEGKKFILPSTTAGSTKRFAITVDDTSTLSVTEVTE